VTRLTLRLLPIVAVIAAFTIVAVFLLPFVVLRQRPPTQGNGLFECVREKWYSKQDLQQPQ
jgi:hypothetical protein